MNNDEFDGDEFPKPRSLSPIWVLVIMGMVIAILLLAEATGLKKI